MKYELTAHESSSLSLSIHGRVELVEEFCLVDSLSPTLLSSSITHFFLSFFFLPLSANQQQHSMNKKDTHKSKTPNKIDVTEARNYPFLEFPLHQDQEQLLELTAKPSELCVS